MTEGTELEAIEAVYAEADAAFARLRVVNHPRIRCGLGCTSCCVDDIRVFEVEAERIRRRYPEVLREEPGPPGRCAFLASTGACRVYEARPYVCRTQGLPLRWLDEEHQTELRDICPVNESEPEDQPVTELPADACWTLGPLEARLAALQSQRSGRWVDGEDRVPLRALFEVKPCGR